MASSLFEPADAAAAAPTTERRTKLYPYDSVAAQLLEPFGESALDSMSLQQLWKAASDGNKKASYHSLLCADKVADKWRVGAGISTTAAALQAAIKHVESPDMEKLLRPELHAKIIQETEQLKPILDMLNVGRGSQKQDRDTGSFREAKRQKTTGTSSVHAYTEAQVLDATKKFHAWLSQDKSAFRGALYILSGSNTYYTAHTAEMVARACVHCKPLSLEEMCECMKARLTKPAEPQQTAHSSTDATGLFD